MLPIRSATVIHNWIDTKVFYPNLTTPSDPRRPFRLLFVGNPSRRKGADLLAPIMQELGSEFELRFTRSTTRRNSFSVATNMTPLERLRHDQGLVATYHQCDALLFPTRFEGFGLSVIEAMACGKPVVASNCCSLPEIVGDGIGGILCPPNDIQAFAQACRELARHREFREQLARDARARAQELFREDRIIPQYVDLYEKLVK
jgi:glycosyltransferase involved in cell wall biosynthesis